MTEVWCRHGMRLSNRSAKLISAPHYAASAAALTASPVVLSCADCTHTHGQNDTLHPGVKSPMIISSSTDRRWGFTYHNIRHLGTRLRSDLFVLSRLTRTSLNCHSEKGNHWNAISKTVDLHHRCFLDNRSKTTRSKILCKKERITSNFFKKTCHLQIFWLTTRLSRRCTIWNTLHI